jgi:hypothetical protein
MFVFNTALLVFWISLIGSGIAKAVSIENAESFYNIMKQLQPWFKVFTLSGFVLLVFIIILVAPLVQAFSKVLFTRARSIQVISFEAESLKEVQNL